MGKKQKKVKGAEKTAAKTEKKKVNKLKKELALIGEENVESLVVKATYSNKRSETTEEVSSAPSPRSNFSLCPHPDKDELLLFGGEYYDGKQMTQYNDLYIYSITKNEWRIIHTNNTPAPRSAHQAVTVAQDGGQMWMFGGEFTSPSESQFHHFKELWVYHIKEKKWEKVNTPSGPSPRSGHRMVCAKRNLVVFGGFYDVGRDYKYFNDVYLFSLDTYKWKQLEVTGVPPAPRSACQIAPLNDGRVVVYGGFSKVHVKKDADQGTTHSDMFLLTPDKHDETGNKWKWVTVKQRGLVPSSRCGFTMIAAGNDIAYMFGGVYDEDEDLDDSGDEDADEDSSFFNDLYKLDMDKGTWYKVHLTGKRSSSKRSSLHQELTHDEVSKQLDSIDMSSTSKHEDNYTVSVGSSSTSSQPSEAGPLVPRARMNAGLVHKKGHLYLYGGMWESMKRRFTLDDMHTLDTRKMTEWRVLQEMSRQVEDYVEESESSESDDDSDMDTD